MDVLNFDLTRMYTILASIVNFKWNVRLEIVQRIFKCSDMQQSSLTADEELNSLIYLSFLCQFVSTYVSYKLLKIVPFYGPPSIHIYRVCQKTDYEIINFYSSLVLRRNAIIWYLAHCCMSFTSKVIHSQIQSGFCHTHS